MIWNSDVMLPSFGSGQAQVAACLASDLVTEPAQYFREVASGGSLGNFYLTSAAASTHPQPEITSSRTKCGRITWAFYPHQNDSGWPPEAGLHNFRTVLAALGK